MVATTKYGMTLSGHMIIKNGVKYDYPFVEACLSALPMCDEFVVLEGYGDDGTYERLIELQKEHAKIRIIREKWDKFHYEVMADMTNKCIEECKCDYHFQIQADEGLSEHYHHKIRRAIERGADYYTMGVLHFFGSFDKVYKPGVFYDTFIRLARRNKYPTMRSCSDAMSLGCPDSNSAHLKHVNLTDVKVHHYGYVRKPKALIEKQADVTRWWGIQELDPFLQAGLDRGHIVWEEKQTPDKIDHFHGNHPSSYRDWIAARKEIVESGRVE